MKTLLMNRDRAFDPEPELPPNAEALAGDLELQSLLDAMADGDQFLFDVARKAIYNGLDRPEDIAYRQDALKDALREPSAVRAIYALTLDVEDAVRRVRIGLLTDSPESVLRQARETLEACFDLLPQLRVLAEENISKFHSDAFTNLFAELQHQLDDDYLETVRDHLERLRFPDGVSMTARLGKGNRGIDYVLREPRHQGLLERIGIHRSSLSFHLDPRDQAGSVTLRNLRDRGLVRVADALAQSAKHVVGFFSRLRSEIGFYVACVNLHDSISGLGAGVCFPEALPPGHPELSCEGLYDIALSLSSGQRVVGNDVEADEKSLVMITGANRGGKSTFLRSLGLAQLMMQSGMFVPADAFRADLRSEVLTHFKREEDSSMESGKLDEELGRMSDLVEMAGPGSLLLCNESFASTNEREGSEIARQIIEALLDAGVKIGFVTHMFELANGFFERGDPGALFLRAERREDGERTFRLIEGEPLPTSYGVDLYRTIFGELPDQSGLGIDDADRISGHCPLGTRVQGLEAE